MDNRKPLPYRSFNPRSYERSDIGKYNIMYFHISFNPRSYERSDEYKLGITGEFKVSIHAPTKGATSYCYCDVVGLAVSIHAPTKGATHFNDRYWNDFTVSIHAPTKGATYCPAANENHGSFNPRSYERSD